MQLHRAVNEAEMYVSRISCVSYNHAYIVFDANAFCVNRSLKALQTIQERRKRLEMHVWSRRMQQIHEMMASTKFRTRL